MKKGVKKKAKIAGWLVTVLTVAAYAICKALEIDCSMFI